MWKVKQNNRLRTLANIKCSDAGKENNIKTIMIIILTFWTIYTDDLFIVMKICVESARLFLLDRLANQGKRDRLSYYFTHCWRGEEKDSSFSNAQSEALTTSSRICHTRNPKALPTNWALQYPIAKNVNKRNLKMQNALNSRAEVGRRNVWAVKLSV